MLLPGPDVPSSTDVPPGTEGVTEEGSPLSGTDGSPWTGTDGSPWTGTDGSPRTGTDGAPGTDNVPCTDRSPGTDSPAGTETTDGPDGPTSVVVPGVASTSMSSFSPTDAPSTRPTGCDGPEALIPAGLRQLL